MITVVIPALNEAETVGDVITLASRYSNDILVVNGHSWDNTVSIAHTLGARVIFDNKKGKGDAIRTAIPHIEREITVFIDADGSHEPGDIPKLVHSHEYKRKIGYSRIDLKKVAFRYVYSMIRYLYF